MSIYSSRRLIIAFLLVFLPVHAHAQLNTADVTGFVGDRTNAAIVEASILMTNVSTGVQREAKTNRFGRFVIPSLIPGVYTVQIVKTGFAPAQLENITLRAGEVRDLQVRMEIGATKQIVEVNSSSLVNTDNPEQNTTLGLHQVDLLPTPSHDWTSLVTQGNGLAMNSSRGTLIMNNLPSGGASITVDGVPAEGQPSLPSFAQYQNFNIIKAVGQEAIQEVSISRGITSADVGATMTGNINVITKSGTDHLRGQIYWLNNITPFNARNAFSTSRLPIIQNQYVAQLGGPILRHKLFYFADYEGYHINSQSNVSGDVPTPEFRAAAIAAVPAYKPWFDLFPNPTASYKPGALSAIYESSGAQKSQDNYGNVRVDYYPAPSLQAVFRYTRARPSQTTPNISPENPKTYIGYTEGGSTSVLHTQGSTLYEGRFGINYNDEDRVEDAYYANTNSIRKFQGIDAGSFEQLFQGGRTLTYEGKVTKQLGRHLLKAGGSYLYRLAQRSDQQAPELQYANEADFLANVPNSVQVTYGVKLYSLTTYQLGSFIQDDWKLSNRLTVNAGMRWDYFAPPHADHDRFYLRAGPYGTGPYLKAGTSWNSQWSSFSPRMGFAYKPDRGGRTVIRSGIGIFYSEHVLYGGPIGSVRDSLTEPTRSTFSRNDVLKDGSLLRFPVVNAATLPLSVSVDSTSTIDQNYPKPYSLQWLLSVEQQISRNWALDLSYVGNHGVHLTTVREVNRPDRVTGVRPVAGLGTFDYYDSTESSKYSALQATLIHQFAHGLQWNLFYTWGHAFSYSNEADIISPNPPQDSYNLNADYGPPDSDVRNRLVSNLVYEPLFSQVLGSRCRAWLCDGWQLGGIVTAQSGSPFTVVQSSGISSSRPDVSGPATLLPNYRKTRDYLSPSSFRLVPLNSVSGLPVRDGTARRDGVYGPGLFDVDLSLGRNVSFREGITFRFEAQMLNAFNHTNYSDPASDLTAPSSFGIITASNNARTIQFTGKLGF